MGWVTAPGVDRSPPGIAAGEGDVLSWKGDEGGTGPMIVLVSGAAPGGGVDSVSLDATGAGVDAGAEGAAGMVKEGSAAVSTTPSTL
jgi:hypothetical protein